MTFTVDMACELNLVFFNLSVSGPTNELQAKFHVYSSYISELYKKYLSCAAFIIYGLAIQSKDHK